MAYDLVIRAGRVVDGTGLGSYTADVAVRDGRIARIGRIGERGAREIDADGLLVTPGFIDTHTHMDAQVNWDPIGTSSCWHGVTSVVMGNCGFTLAPVRRGEEKLVLRNLERAEDISAAAMQHSVKWQWETFPEYLDVLEQLPMGINYSANIGHSALRTWAMGERAFEDQASEEELAMMEHELASALDAGAVGFTTSRSTSHETSDDRPVASRIANWEEVRRLVKVMASRDGVFQLAGERSPIPEEVDDYHRRLVELAIETGALFTFGVQPTPHWRQLVGLIDETIAGGGRMVGQMHSRGCTILLSFRTNLPFDVLPEWREVRARPLEEQKLLLRDPAVRARLVHAAHHGNYGRWVGAEAGKPDYALTRIYGTPLPPHPTVEEVARQRGVDPVECMIDLALENDFNLFFRTPCGQMEIDEDGMQAMLQRPHMTMTFSDSGAHVGQIVDSCMQTHMLAHWSRDKQYCSTEDAIRLMTLGPARAFGFNDRGLLREGMVADINLIELDRLHPGLPEVRHDLPGGDMRLIIKPEGMRKTIVAGEVLIEDGEHTGALPGKLIRATH